MKNFQNKGDRKGGFGRSRGGYKSGSRGGFSGGDRDRKVTMHKTVCSECHKECEVPFRPSLDKPVFCSECFGGKKETGDRSERREFNSNRVQFAGPSQEDFKKELLEVNTKLNRLIDILEKILVEKPVAINKSAKKTNLKSAVKKVSKK